MGRLDRVLAVEIGDRPGNLEDPVEGPGAEAELGHGHLQELLGLVRDGAEELDLPGTHLGVGEDLPSPEPASLPIPRPGHPCPDGRRAFGRRPGDDVPELDLGHLELDVDPVEERPGDLGIVPGLFAVRAIGPLRDDAPENVGTPLCCLSVI